VRGWNLLPAEIRAAANVARGGPEAVVQACRRLLHRDQEGLLTKLACPYTWDDIVLPAAMRKQIEELASQARLQTAVLEDWGFERLCPMGRGISALFAGPSGTGKTMAAQIIARALDRELCRVDLAEVVNKYIGETEKRLKRVFDACERAAVVLFFDEADALFGQRTQVRDSHDRYANIQIDYLLQRMEQFNGIAVLSTNRMSDLDTAFMRRLRFVINFVPPGPEERLTLWRLALPDRSPAGVELLDQIDWQWLADKLILTGAEIKAIALAAAFLARADRMRIGMDHVLHAARREMAKHGASWRTGEWSPRPNA
jgi:SpoVK/Ycf46/Vps4 family AAA+-type ATPase